MRFHINTKLGAALVFSLALITGCGSPTPLPSQPTAVERPTATPLPQAPTWRPASQPISMDNIQQISLLGRLEAPGEVSTIFAYALSPDNTRLAALNNTYLIVWDLVTGDTVFYTTRQDETQVFYSPAKDELYAVGAGGTIYILNSETGIVEEVLNAQDDYNRVLDYQHDLGLMALASRTGEIRVWDLFERVALATLPGGSGEVFSLDFSADGERLAATYEDTSIQVWNWRQRTPALDLVPLSGEQRIPINQVRFSPDDQLLIGMTQRFGAVWDTTSGQQRFLLSTGEGGGSYLFKFAPSGDYLIAGGLSRETTLWTLATGQLASALPGIGGNNLDAVFSPDGMLVLTSLFEQGVTLWNLDNLANGTIARSTQPFDNANILNLLWTDDGFLVLMFDSRGPVEVWGIP